MNIGIDIRGIDGFGGIPQFMRAIVSHLKNNDEDNFFFFTDKKVRIANKKCNLLVKFTIK